MADARFVGGWDLYAGGVHSLLALSDDGGYVHAMWGDQRRHWGQWDVEMEGGQPSLVLRLADAFPRVVPGPFGPQPVPWPAWEAWAIVDVGAEQVRLADGVLVRRHDAPQPAPRYAAPPPLAPAPAPTATGFSSGPRFSPPPAAPPVPAGFDPAEVAKLGVFAASAPSAAAAPAAQGGGGQPTTPAPLPPILQQWKDQHATWDQVRQIAADIRLQDAKTTQTINNAWQAQLTAEIAARQATMQARSDAIHAGTQAMINSVLRR